MFSGVRKHINVATLIAVVALVFAMTGGAFAVTGGGKGLSGSATVAKKKSVSKGVRGPAGPRGATGPAGPAGPQGAAGAQGPQGAKGETGAAGASGAPGVKGETGPQGLQGKEGKQGEQGEPGPAGTTGFTKTLPSGETETGTWNVFAKQAEKVQSWFAPISFSIPLKAGLAEAAFHYIKTGEQTNECPGTVEIPKAAVGQFCLYQGMTIQPESQPGLPSELEVVKSIEAPGGNGGAGTSGAIIHVVYEGPSPAEESIVVNGSWAVTAP